MGIYLFLITINSYLVKIEWNSISPKEKEMLANSFSKDDVESSSANERVN